jgi:deoxyribonuclease-2
LGLGSNAYTYAQHLLCLSLNTQTLNSISNKFLLNRPQIYEYSINTNKYEYINDLINEKFSDKNICDSEILQSIGGFSFKLYAKSAEWNNDLYSECITPSESDTLLVESWIRGSAEGPICPITKFDTLDIKYLDFGNNNNWSETNDHSKWAITMNNNIICMGDINRMTTQYLRGGGSTCFNDSILHDILKTAIKETDKC